MGAYAPALGRIVAEARMCERALRAGRTAVFDTEAATLDDLFEQFMRGSAHRPSTEALYRAAWANHIQPTLGARLAQSITPADLEAWKDAGSGSLRHATRLLKAVLERATRRGVLSSNPARVLRSPQAGVRSLRPDEVLTADQVRELADAVGERYSALIYLLAYGGLRIGEAVALRVRDVDFDRRRLSVSKSATEVGGRLEFGPPKTRAGERTIALPRFLVDMLRDHVERYPTDTGLVFSAPAGGPLRLRSFYTRVFTPVIERLGLPALQVHDLRHVAASSLAAQGGTAAEIAARLGHASVGITQAVYTHMLAARDERLANLQDASWDGDAQLE